MRKFQWENKEQGTFFLHGDRWMIYKDHLTGTMKIKPNYNLHVGQKVNYTAAMRKTIDRNICHIGALYQKFLNN